MTPTAKQKKGQPLPPEAIPAALVTTNDRIKDLRARLDVAQSELIDAQQARQATKAAHDEARVNHAETQKIITASAEDVKTTLSVYQHAHDLVDAKARAVNRLAGELASLTGQNEAPKIS